MLRRLGLGVLLLLALHLFARFLVEVPTARYVATCGPDPFARTYIRGPYNKQFLDLLQQVLQREGFPYSRRDGFIYVPYMGLSNETYDGYQDFSLNVDWKVVDSIVRGIKIGGGYNPPPRPLAVLLKTLEPKYGPLIRRADTPDGSYDLDLDLRLSEDACAFMRAAILKEPDSRERP